MGGGVGHPPFGFRNQNGGSSPPAVDLGVLPNPFPRASPWHLDSEIQTQGNSPWAWISQSSREGWGARRNPKAGIHLYIYIIIRVRSYSGVDMLQGFEDMLQDLTCCAFATKHSHMGGCLIYPSLEAQPRPCGLAQAQPHTITIPPSPSPSQHIISTSHLFLPSILVVVSSIPHNT